MKKIEELFDLQKISSLVTTVLNLKCYGVYVDDSMFKDYINNDFIVYISAPEYSTVEIKLDEKGNKKLYEGEELLKFAKEELTNTICDVWLSGLKNDILFSQTTKEELKKFLKIYGKIRTEECWNQENYEKVHMEITDTLNSLKENKGYSLLQ